MPNIPTENKLSTRVIRGPGLRSQPDTKNIEQTTDAHKLQTVPVSPTLPTNGQVPMYDAITGRYVPSTVAAAAVATGGEAPISVFSAQELSRGPSTVRFLASTDPLFADNLVFSPGGILRAQMMVTPRDGGAIFYNPTVFLSAAITTTTQTTINLTATGPVNGQHIRIDTEAMLVTAGGGTTTLTVARGRLTTVAATHVSGSMVKFVNVESVMEVWGGLRALGGVATQDLVLQGYSTHELEIRATFTEPIPTIADGQTEFGRMKLDTGGHSHATDVNYAVEIDGGGGVGYATFRWSDDGGATWNATGVLVQAGQTPISLQNGVTISFAQGSYFVGNRWDFTAIGTDNQVTLLKADTVNERLTFAKAGGGSVVLGPAVAGYLLEVNNGFVGINTGVIAGGTGFEVTDTGSTETLGGATLARVRLNPILGADGLSVTGLQSSSQPDNSGRVGTTIYNASDNLSLGGGTYALAVGRRIVIGTNIAFADPILTALYGLRIENSGLAPAATSGISTAIEIPNVGHVNFATVTGLDILSQTAGGTATYNIRQRGTTGVNRLAAPTLIGADASPAAGVALELNAGKFRLATGTTNGIIEDAAGADLLVAGSVTTAETVTTTLPSHIRANNVVALGGAPSTGTTAARLQLSTWRELGGSASQMITVTLTGLQTANSTSRTGFGFSGTYGLDGFNLTSATGGFIGISSAPLLADAVGGGVLTRGIAIKGQGVFGSGGASGPIVTMYSVFEASAISEQSGGTAAITNMAGLLVRNQGNAIVTGTSVAVDIEAQSGSTANRTIRALGTAPSIHEPALLVGANAAPAVSAILELQTTTGALLFPRMTTAQKNALTPLLGMVVFDTTLNTFEGYQGAGAWAAL